MRGVLRLGFAAVAVTVLVVAFIGLHLARSGLNFPAYAYIADINGNTTISPSYPGDKQDTHVELDLRRDGGGTWCNPINAWTSFAVGETYQVALCLTTTRRPPGSFRFEIAYDATVNDCVDRPHPDVDSNPDANLGFSTFDGTLPVTANGLGSGWSCNIDGAAPPTCSNLEGRAFLQCDRLAGTTELPTGNFHSEPLAVMTFKALAPGLDLLRLWNVEVDDASGGAYVDCFPNDANYCLGGVVAVATQPATPTPTRSPTATPTPHGVGGAVLLPPGVVSGSNGAHRDSAAMYGVVAAILAASAIAGGWYATRRRSP